MKNKSVDQNIDKSYSELQGRSSDINRSKSVNELIIESYYASPDKSDGNSDMTNPDDQDMMLGSTKTFWQSLLLKITFPKLFTKHYNVNGLNVYRSYLTITVFFGIFSYFIYVLSVNLLPLFYKDYYVSSTLSQTWLKNNLDIHGNTTADTYFGKIWQKYVC